MSNLPTRHLSLRPLCFRLQITYFIREDSQADYCLTTQGAKPVLRTYWVTAAIFYAGIRTKRILFEDKELIVCQIFSTSNLPIIGAKACKEQPGAKNQNAVNC